MPVFALVRQAAYVDSVTLLQLTSDLAVRPDVTNAAAVMATELNREVLREAGLLAGDALNAGPNDLVIAVEAEDDGALAYAEELLRQRRWARDTAAERVVPRSLRSAHRADPDARLAVISVPGPYAAAEARQALAEGLHVFLFSDNVSIEAEVELKRAGRDRNLLVMGPDCGTAIINGVGLGFANVVRRGRIGVVGASGTGIQEVVSLIHKAGSGISHAIGTGSRDLSAAVGGTTTLQALELLRDDTTTETIVLVSKPSDPAVAATALQALAGTGKPAVAYLQGVHVAPPTGVRLADNLEEAAQLAMGRHAMAASARRTPTGLVRGLFCGGTLCKEAALALGAAQEHQLIDFGDDEYTRGRAHPMIDPTLRNQAIVDAGRDTRVRVVLLDFILGLGAHPDPVGAALPAIHAALSTGRDRNLRMAAHVVGTDADPQDLARQETTLRDAGVEVFPSNYRAALMA